MAQLKALPTTRNASCNVVEMKSYHKPHQMTSSRRSQPGCFDPHPSLIAVFTPAKTNSTNQTIAMRKSRQSLF